MKKSLFASATCLILLWAASAQAAPFPPIGADTLGPAVLITFAANGTVTVGPGPGAAQGPYDGIEDTYIGVINNSGTPIKSINLVTLPGAWGFDDDGITTVIPGVPSNSMDSTGYGGPNAFFTNFINNSTSTTGTVNFITPIPAGGGQDYFSLELSLPPSGVIVGGVPEPTTIALLGVGIGALALYRRRSGKSV
jgi:hypothetical protein